MSYSRVSWAYRDPATVQKMTQMEDNTVWTSEHRIIGCEIDLTGTSTSQIKGGRIEIGGAWLMRDGATTTGLVLTAETTTHWEGSTGFVETSSTAYYIVAYNDSGSSFQIKYRVSAPAYSDTASGTATGNKIYDKTGSVWYRYIGSVWNNDQNAIEKYIQRDDEVWYDNPWTNTNLTVLSTGGQVNFTTVNCSGRIPPLSNQGRFLVQGYGGAVNMAFRVEGSVAATGLSFVAPASVGVPIELSLSDNRKFDYKVDSLTATIWVAGYKLNCR